MPTGGTDTGFPMSFPTGNSDRGILYGALSPAGSGAGARGHRKLRLTTRRGHHRARWLRPMNLRQRLPKPTSAIPASPTCAHEGSYVRIDGPRIWMELVGATRGGRQHQAALPRAVARQAVRLRRRDRPLMNSRAAWLLALLCVARCGAALRAQRAEFFREARPSLRNRCAPKCWCQNPSSRTPRPQNAHRNRLRHTCCVTCRRRLRKVRRGRWKCARCSHTTYLEHAYLSAQVEFTPPAGASPARVRADRRRGHA